MSRVACCLTLFVVLAIPTAALADDVRVTVVAILASDRHKNIDKQLTAIADEIRKRDASFQSSTGWKLERTTVKNLKLEQKESFPLVADVAAEVVVTHRDDKENRVRVTVKCPHAGEITYTTVPDKYFPVITRYQTEKDKDRLIFAVMVKKLPLKVDNKSGDKEKTPEKP